MEREQELKSIATALESGITEDEYWWSYTPAQLLRRFDAMRKKKEERMWEMGWFTKMLLNVQGDKTANVYDLLPFPDPNAVVEGASSFDVATPNDVAYMKALMRSKQGR